MSRGHEYLDGVRGRSWSSSTGTTGTVFKARIQCGQCAASDTVQMRHIMTPRHIDLKFIQRGWRIPPRFCPACAAKSKEKKPMASKPSAGAVKATAKMFTLLSQHFDADNGRYVAGWTDGKIAKETGMAPEAVTEFRREAFGEIKEPAEFALIRADINSLEKLAADNHTAITADIAKLRGQLAQAVGKMGIPA
ncbi:hypothetical protein EIK56_25030 [Sphingomonas sp. C8-2]|nr:hypothetical protein EIK56_25030 [Sphingomonas sp. C8-2]